jgi:hypothetical protein
MPEVPGDAMMKPLLHGIGADLMVVRAANWRLRDAAAFAESRKSSLLY